MARPGLRRIPTVHGSYVPLSDERLKEIANAGLPVDVADVLWLELIHMARELAENRAPSQFTRAHQDTPCGVCHRPYRLHSYHPVRDKDGEPFLHVLCDGSAVKL